MNESRPPASESCTATQEERVRGVELLISHLLRGGVLTSLTIVLAGLLLSFLHHPSYLSSPEDLRHLTRPGAAFPHTPADIAAGLRTLRGQAVVMVGLLVLIATPVLRVAVSILLFFHQRDRDFVWITLVVLTLLLASFALGPFAGG
jgi:uncharacterized membrane protein